MFLRNVGSHKSLTGQYPKRRHSSWSPQWITQFLHSPHQCFTFNVKPSMLNFTEILPYAFELQKCSFHGSHLYYCESIVQVKGSISTLTVVTETLTILQWNGSKKVAKYRKLWETSKSVLVIFLQYFFRLYSKRRSNYNCFRKVIYDVGAVLTCSGETNAHRFHVS
jgi:hypothetical protein